MGPPPFLFIKRKKKDSGPHKSNNGFSIRKYSAPSAFCGVFFRWCDLRPGCKKSHPYVIKVKIPSKTEKKLAYLWKPPFLRSTSPPRKPQKGFFLTENCNVVPRAWLLFPWNLWGVSPPARVSNCAAMALLFIAWWWFKVFRSLTRPKYAARNDSGQTVGSKESKTAFSVITKARCDLNDFPQNMPCARCLLYWFAGYKSVQHFHEPSQETSLSRRFAAY